MIKPSEYIVISNGVDINGDQIRLAILKTSSKINGEGLIHVIEYSAVEALQSQVENLEAENERQGRVISWMALAITEEQKSVMSLQSKLDNAIEALKYIAQPKTSRALDQITASKTLAELEK